jgi:hypothetical protein
VKLSLPPAAGSLLMKATRALSALRPSHPADSDVGSIGSAYVNVIVSPASGCA